MKHFLSILLIMLSLFACQNNETVLDNVLSNTQWKSSNSIYYNDIKNNISPGYILDFVSNDRFLIEYHDRKLNDGTDYIVPSATGNYLLDGTTLQLLLDNNEKILYTISDDRMAISYAQSQLSSQYNIDFPQKMHLSKDGGKSSGDLLTNKEWKLISISIGDSNKQADIWDGDIEEREKSMNALINPQNYILRFNGNPQWIKNKNEGNFSANVINYTINGTWHANAITGYYNQSFENYTSENNDKLEDLFLIGMNNSSRFDSNGHLLVLYFIYNGKNYNMHFTNKSSLKQ